MGTDIVEVVETLPYPCAVKIHRSMCTKLVKLVDKISKILPEIEAARPRCSGIEALCLLNSALERAKSLVQYCSESSKLYLAFTGNVIVSRCERSRDCLEKSLSQIKTMVPVPLAIEISHVIEDLRVAKFILDSSEEEAGKAVRALFQKDASGSDPIETSVIEALKLAASRLHITSSKALLIEKRSIKKLLDKVSDADTVKKKILRFLLYLLKKYGKLLAKDQTENESPRHKESHSFTNSCTTIYGHYLKEDSCVEYVENEARTDKLSKSIPPEEFICPLSLRLMFEPVIIDSGQTFERTWIQKWFEEGNDVCPKTRGRLTRLTMTPNTVIKDLISKWCKEQGITIVDPGTQQEMPNSWEASSGSIASFGSSVNDLCFPADFSDVSVGSLDASFSSNPSKVKITNGLTLMSTPTRNDFQDTEPEYLSELAALSWESQCKAVEDVNNCMISNELACRSMSSVNLLVPLTRFLNDARDQHDVDALRSGSQLFLAFVSKRRSEEQYLGDDVFALLASLLYSEVSEAALAIIEVLSEHLYNGTKIAASGALTFILMNLNARTRKFQEPAIKILYNLSSSRENHSLIVSLECIPKLVPLMADTSLAKHCIVILRNLSEAEEARVSVAETEGCIAAIAELLENGSHEDQEHAVAVLLSLCSQRVQYCQLVEEDVFTSLVNISLNGNNKGKVSASELLRILRDFFSSDVQECSEPPKQSSYKDTGDNPKEKRLPTRTSGFFGRFSRFSKPTRLSSRKKK